MAVIISSIIDQTAAPAELEKDDGFGGSSPAKTRRLSEARQGGAQHIHEGIKWMWGVYGVVLHVHVNQVGSWP